MTVRYGLLAGSPVRQQERRTLSGIQLHERPEERPEFCFAGRGERVCGTAALAPGYSVAAARAAWL